MIMNHDTFAARVKLTLISDVDYPILASQVA